MKIITSLGRVSKPTVAISKTQCVLQLWETTVLSFQCTHCSQTKHLIHCTLLQKHINKVMEMLEISIYYGVWGLISLKNLTTSMFHITEVLVITLNVQFPWPFGVFHAPITTWICLIFFSLASHPPTTSLWK